MVRQKSSDNGRNAVAIIPVTVRESGNRRSPTNSGRQAQKKNYIEGGGAGGRTAVKRAGSLLPDMPWWYVAGSALTVSLMTMADRQTRPGWA